MADDKTPQGNQPDNTPKAPTLEELKAENEKLKKAISASNADAAKHKRDAEEWQGKYKATLDEQEKAKLEAEETLKRLTAENEQFKAEKRISAYTAKLMGAGFDQATASAMASTLPDGIPDSFFEGQKAFLEAQKQAFKTQNLNSQPNLPVGAAPSTGDTMSAIDKQLRASFGL